MIIGLFLTVLTSNAFADDVAVQCRTFRGAPVVEILYSQPEAWDGMSSIPLSEYRASPSSYRPRLEGVSHLKAHYRFLDTPRTLVLNSPSQVQEIRLREQDGQVHLEFLVANKVVITLIGLLEIADGQIYFAGSGAGNVIEHGGFLHGTIDGEPVICAFDLESNLKREFEIR